ncbi:hypothetical protein [Acinetobacter nosocomialis]|uniref:hypothetical protein n=1 Tax=Acinetobacter nosocomialis TaxID=106654 RepID=UPI002D1EB949|nr:hypothetical protein [Acinetobacter nosocomialis]MEB3855519.1 hypothetical protein [Acinetobacter nosocomialis]
MRMSRVLLATALGMAVARPNFGTLSALSAMGGEVSPFVFKSKPNKGKPNKLSQKKKRLIARRLNKRK